MVHVYSLVLILLFLIPSTAFSQDSSTPMYSRSGVYVGVGGGVAFDNFQEGAGEDVDPSFGANLRLGYRFGEYLAIEAEYLWLNGFDVLDVGEIDGFSASGNAKFYPLTGNVQPYFIAGVGFLELNGSVFGIQVASGSDLFFKWGAGIDTYISEHVVLYLEAAYSNPTGDIKRADFIPVLAGIQFRF